MRLVSTTYLVIRMAKFKKCRPISFRQVFVGLQEGLLQDIFGVFPVLRDILRQPKDIALVALGQLAERCAIALASLGDQAGFIENGGFLWQISFYHRLVRASESRTEPARDVAPVLDRVRAGPAPKWRSNALQSPWPCCRWRGHFDLSRASRRGAAELRIGASRGCI